MNLEISPDLEAYWCYAIVVGAGLLAAIQQVRARLPSRSAWRLLETYLLFLAYLCVPLLLFWFLDRTGAINDTSLFAALLVGFGYERILTGGLDKVQLPGEVSRLWQPFVAWADRVANSAGKHLLRQRDRFEEKLLTSIITDPAKFEELNKLARELAADPGALSTQLQKIETDHPAADQVIIRRKKVRLLYNQVLRVPDAPYLLKGRGLVSNVDYWRYWLDLRSIVTIGIFVLVLLAGIGSAVELLYQNERISYYVWRIEKQNASKLDQFRNREHLAVELDGRQRSGSQERLVRSLRKPGVGVDRVDVIVGLLLQKRRTDTPEEFDCELATQFAEALRADSVDVRTRVHEALRFLFREHTRHATSPTTLPADLETWVPSQGDSPMQLEDHIRLWRVALGLDK